MQAAGDRSGNVLAALDDRGDTRLGVEQVSERQQHGFVVDDRENDHNPRLRDVVDEVADLLSVVPVIGIDNDPFLYEVNG